MIIELDLYAHVKLKGDYVTFESRNDTLFLLQIYSEIHMQ